MRKAPESKPEKDRATETSRQDNSRTELFIGGDQNHNSQDPYWTGKEAGSVRTPGGRACRGWETRSWGVGGRGECSMGPRVWVSRVVVTWSGVLGLKVLEGGAIHHRNV